MVRHHQVHCSAISNFELDTEGIRTATEVPHVIRRLFVILLLLIGIESSSSSSRLWRGWFQSLYQPTIAGVCCRSLCIMLPHRYRRRRRSSSSSSLTLALCRLPLHQHALKHGLQSKSSSWTMQGTARRLQHYRNPLIYFFAARMMSISALICSTTPPCSLRSTSIQYAICACRRL
jgi:hypothetical protein